MSYGFYPGGYILLTGVVNAFAAHEHGLDDDLAIEGFKLLYDLRDVIRGRLGLVNLADVCHIDGVEFLDVVIDLLQGFEDIGLVKHGGIAQHGNLGIGEVAVSGFDGIVDDAGKVGVAGGFAIACEGYDIERLTFLVALAEHLGESLTHFFAGRASALGASLAVKAAFAIDAVKRTYLAIGWHEVYAQRNAEAPGMYWAEYGAVV